MQSKRFLLSLIIIIFVFFYSKESESGPSGKNQDSDHPSLKFIKSENDVGIVVAKSGFPFRAFPSISVPVRKVLPAGTIVKIIGYKPPSSTIGDQVGFWIKAETGGIEGWIFATSSFSMTKTQENDLYVTRSEGLDVFETPFEAPFENSKVISTLKYGEKVRVFTEGFKTNELSTSWNIVQIGDKKGFVNDSFLTVKLYSKEEIEKAPFVGLVYEGNLGNCKSGSFSIVEHSGTPKDRTFALGYYDCKGIGYIVLEEEIGRIKNSAIFKILFILKEDPLPESPGGFFVTSHINTHTDIACYTKDETQIPIAFVNLRKGSAIDLKKGTKYTNVIEKTWFFDGKLNTLVIRDAPGSYCYLPDVSESGD